MKKIKYLFLCESIGKKNIRLLVVLLIQIANKIKQIRHICTNKFYLRNYLQSYKYLHPWTIEILIF